LKLVPGVVLSDPAAVSSAAFSCGPIEAPRASASLAA